MDHKELPESIKNPIYLISQFLLVTLVFHFQELIDKTNLSVSRMVLEGLDHFNIVENLMQDDYLITRLIINNLK